MPIPPKTRGDPGHHEDIQAEDAEELGQVAAFCRRVAIVCEAFQGAGNQCPLTSHRATKAMPVTACAACLKVGFFIMFPFTIATRFGFLLTNWSTSASDMHNPRHLSSDFPCHAFYGLLSALITALALPSSFSQEATTDLPNAAKAASSLS